MKVKHSPEQQSIFYIVHKQHLVTKSRILAKFVEMFLNKLASYR